MMKNQSGLTLLEVLIASAIMAVIATLSAASFDVSQRSKEASEENMRNLQQFDRGWTMLENDLRNALAQIVDDPYRNLVPAMEVSYGDEYVLKFIRGGRANPLGFPRTELARVGYRIEDQTLWRDIWVDPGNTDEDLARSQKIFDGVEDVKVRVLPTEAQGYKEGPWVEEWPGRQQPPDLLPLAVEITVTTKARGEIKRLFPLSLGR